MDQDKGPEDEEVPGAIFIPTLAGTLPGASASAVGGPGPGPGGSVLLVGVAHVLDLEKALDRMLASFQPRALAIELDRERAQVLTDRVQERQRLAASGSDRPPPRASGEAPFMLRMWAHMQDRFASELGGVPGEEMLAVATFAQKRRLPCFLVDDPLREVAPRLMSSLTGKERVRLLVATVLGLFIPARVVQREIQQYSEHREEYLEAMRQQYPTLTRVLLDERNLHMAARITEIAARYGRLAAVVGDAHVSGLAQALAGRGLRVEQAHLEKLTAVPAARP